MRTGAMHGIRKGPVGPLCQLHCEMDMGDCHEDDAVVVQGSHFEVTWMPFKGDWILLSKQWGDPKGVWTQEEHDQS